MAYIPAQTVFQGPRRPGDISPPPERLETKQMAGRQCVRGRRDIIAAIFEAHGTRLLSFFWEHELNPSPTTYFRRHIIRKLLGTSALHSQIHHLYRQGHIGATHL